LEERHAVLIAKAGQGLLQQKALAIYWRMNRRLACGAGCGRDAWASRGL
jgi:hypothetical protein